MGEDEGIQPAQAGGETGLGGAEPQAIPGKAGGEAEPRPGRAPGRGLKVRKPGPYSPEERRQAVEAYLKSQATLEEFSRLWGVGSKSLWWWLKVYHQQGPKGLETGICGKGAGKRGKKPLAEPLREEIRQTKRRFPDFGFRKVRDYLARFRGVRVSAGSVRKTLKEAGVAPLPKPRKRFRMKPAVRHFERAHPMQLWQSDITSFVLTRHSQRVYLTAFLDDHSRYVVSWGLHLHQRQEIVIEALLDGIQRFGKPEEVLTDQGRQYASWRGKSDFRKVLEREGIRHVVSRTHHPQTLGKTERFWETVGNEFWGRVHPQELSEARERLGHFIAHYNHRRPHQGIEGMVPADRFFGVESEVRKALETAMDANELRLAIGEKVEPPTFVVGQIEGRPVTFHKERGRLVIEGGDHGRGAGENGAGDAAASGGEEAGPAEADARGAGAVSGAGEGVVGEREPGGAGEGAPGGVRGAGDVGGDEDEGGGGQGAGGAAVTDVAVEPAGGIGDGSGSSEATEDEEGRPDGGKGAGGGGSEGAPEADRGVGEGPGAGEGAGGGPEGSADEPGPTAGGGGGGPGEGGKAPEGGEGCRKAGIAGNFAEGWGHGSCGEGAEGVTGNGSPGGLA